MKKIYLFLLLLTMGATASHAQTVVKVNFDVILGNRPPSPSEAQLMHAEEMKHPNITKAMNDIQDGLRRLHDAPDDFGGHKGQAENDLRQAWVSLRKALYFRIYEDRR